MELSRVGSCSANNYGEVWRIMSGELKNKRERTTTVTIDPRSRERAVKFPNDALSMDERDECNFHEASVALSLAPTSDG